MYLMTSKECRMIKYNYYIKQISDVMEQLQALHTTLIEDQGSSSIHAIALHICREIEVTPIMLQREDRKPRIVDIRTILCYQAYINGHTYNAIGKYLGRHHTSIISMVKRHKDLMMYDPNYKKLYSTLIPTT
jgi:chromosomal replication initiation ATPase DnaA